MDKFTLIGHPLGHSLSPYIHKRLFEMRSRNAEYTLTNIDDLEKIDLRQFKGFNVTIPYKKDIIKFLDDFSAAEEFGAVNCVDNKNGKLFGYNTDSFGFLGSIPLNMCESNLLMFGFGGVGVMVANEVKKSKGKLTVVCREGKSMDEALAFAQNHEFVTVCSNADFTDKFAETHFDLLINSTPVGMFPKTEDCITTAKIVSNCSFVFDFIYNPPVTKLLKIAENCKIPNIGGLKMLVLQAAKSHTIWQGDVYNEIEIFKIIKECEKLLNSSK
jgi:shikimate dehydrogenase